MLVGDGDVAKHREAKRVSTLAEEHLEVCVDEHHHRVDELLGHEELDPVELGPLHLGLDGLAQVVRAVLEDLVDLIGG